MFIQENPLIINSGKKSDTYTTIKKKNPYATEALKKTPKLKLKFLKN